MRGNKRWMKSVLTQAAKSNAEMPWVTIKRAKAQKSKIFALRA